MGLIFTIYRMGVIISHSVASCTLEIVNTVNRVSLSIIVALLLVLDSDESELKCNLPLINCYIFNIYLVSLKSQVLLL